MDAAHPEETGWCEAGPDPTVLETHGKAMQREIHTTQSISSRSRQRRFYKTEFQRQVCHRSGWPCLEYQARNRSVKVTGTRTQLVCLQVGEGKRRCQVKGCRNQIKGMAALKSPTQLGGQRPRE